MYDSEDDSISASSSNTDTSSNTSSKDNDNSNSNSSNESYENYFFGTIKAINDHDSGTGINSSYYFLKHTAPYNPQPVNNFRDMTEVSINAKVIDIAKKSIDLSRAKNFIPNDIYFKILLKIRLTLQFKNLTDEQRKLIHHANIDEKASSLGNELRQFYKFIKRFHIFATDEITLRRGFETESEAVILKAVFPQTNALTNSSSDKNNKSCCLPILEMNFFNRTSSKSVHPLSIESAPIDTIDNKI